LAPARSRDPAATVKLAAIPAARQAVVRGRGHLLYLDATDRHRLPVVRAMGMQGPRVRVPTPGQNARQAFFGALEAASGHWHGADHPTTRAVPFVAFLDQLAAASPVEPLSVGLDHAPIHTAKVVHAWLDAHPRVQALWLPTSAAHQANPTERIWGLLKTAVAANRLAGNREELVLAARQLFTELTPHPIQLPTAA
jgi:hypothetical protein